jgi:H+/Cl- antiporter ClcA
MSVHRPPASACWQSLLAVPLLLFVFLLLILYFFSPEAGHAQVPQVEVVTELEDGGFYNPPPFPDSGKRVT